MKEAVQIAYQDSSVSFEERINAMDRLEFLVEVIDNANDLKPLNLWQIIMSGLKESNSLICQKTASIIGTALQNNESSQLEFARLDGISLLLDIINKSTCPRSLSKLLFSLSCKLCLIICLYYIYSFYSKLHICLEFILETFWY